MTVNDGMTGWPEISCQRGHRTHATQKVTVRLGGPTPYFDYPPVPDRFARIFDMNVWKLRKVSEDLPYCPAADVVSETINVFGVWETPETIVMLDCFERSPDNLFVDIGAQLGWYSLLAATSGLDVYAIEADPEVARVLKTNLTGVQATFILDHRRFVEGSTLLPTSGRNLTVKIDIEGGEPHAINALLPLMEQSKVDFILIEMSPCFNDGYGALTRRIMEAGFAMGTLPNKSDPPARLDTIDDLEWSISLNRSADWVERQQQVNVLFAHPAMIL